MKEQGCSFLRVPLFFVFGSYKLPKGVVMMSRYTKEDIIRMVKEEDVEFIRNASYGYFGQLKMWQSQNPKLKKQSTTRL